MTIVVAPSVDQAQAQAIRYPELCLVGARLITTDRQPDHVGLMSLASDVLLLDGWDRGPHAQQVERLLRRALAKRSQTFDDVRRVGHHRPRPDRPHLDQAVALTRARYLDVSTPFELLAGTFGVHVLEAELAFQQLAETIIDQSRHPRAVRRLVETIRWSLRWQRLRGPHFPHGGWGRRVKAAGGRTAQGGFSLCVRVWGVGGFRRWGRS